MSMTKKDYELIANTIKSTLGTYGGTVSHNNCKYAINDLALAIANELKLDNPKFDRDKFLAACGVK